MDLLFDIYAGFVLPLVACTPFIMHMAAGSDKPTGLIVLFPILKASVLFDLDLSSFLRLMPIVFTLRRKKDLRRMKADEAHLIDQWQPRPFQRRGFWFCVMALLALTVLGVGSTGLYLAAAPIPEACGALGGSCTICEIARCRSR